MWTRLGAIWATDEVRRPSCSRGLFHADSAVRPLEPDRDGRLGWRVDPGFLTGAAGIGLALLAAVAPVKPEWDRLLLVSIPPRDRI